MESLALVRETTKALLPSLGWGASWTKTEKLYATPANLPPSFKVVTVTSNVVQDNLLISLGILIWALCQKHEQNPGIGFCFNAKSMY